MGQRRNLLTAHKACGAQTCSEGQVKGITCNNTKCYACNCEISNVKIKVVAQVQMFNSYGVTFFQAGGCGSMHHFSTELLSTSDSALFPYLNTDPPFIHGFLSFTLRSTSNSLHHTAINQHVQSR